MRKLQVDFKSFIFIFFLNIGSGVFIDPARASVYDNEKILDLPSNLYNYNSVCSFIDKKWALARSQIPNKNFNTVNKLETYKTHSFYINYIRTPDKIIIYLIKINNYGLDRETKTKSNIIKLFGISDNTRIGRNFSLGCDAATLIVISKNSNVMSLMIKLNFVD